MKGRLSALKVVPPKPLAFIHLLQTCYVDCCALFIFETAIDEANVILSGSPGNREIHTMGWLSEQVYVGGDSPKPEWKPVFLALTDKDMLLYDAVAFTLEDWASPFMSHPLLATR